MAVIPARGGSKRLPRKNLHPVAGRPMIEWVIGACRDSERIDDVFVSTEDPEISDVSRRAGARVIARPAALAEDHVYKQDVIVHAAGEIARDGAVELVASVQPNSPELRGSMLDAAIDKLREHGLWEVFSVDERLIQNGAFRVMRYAVVAQRTLSVHCGVMIADVIDVHTLEDVARVEARWARRRTDVPDLRAP